MDLSLLHHLNPKIIIVACTVAVSWNHMTVSKAAAETFELSAKDIESIMISAGDGDAPNQYIAGVLYQAGEHIAADQELAVKWFQKAAEQGYAPAELSIGTAYDVGYGVEQNDELAFEWYHNAAKQNLPDAQYNLAVMYDQGRGTEIDYTEASKWYEASARQGYANAQFNLAGMYSEGDGVSKDYQKAYMWMSVAHKSGYEDAKPKIDWLSGKMSEDELEQARSITETCLSSNLSICGT